MPWLSTAADLTVWISLFSFLFLMKFMMDKLTSENPAEFMAKARSTKIQVAFVLFNYVFLVYGVEFAINYITDPKVDDALLIVRTVSKLFADVYCFVTFFVVIRFFVKKKTEANKLNERPPLSAINKYAISYTILQYVL